MICIRGIITISVPTATDNKLWGKDNFSEKMDSLAKEFEKAGKADEMLIHLCKEHRDCLGYEPGRMSGRKSL